MADDFKPFPHIATDLIHAGQDPEQWNSKAVVPPISLSTTFKQFAPAEHAGFDYSRSGNPSRDVLEKCIAASEGGKYGLCFASGLAALTTVIHTLKAGDHVLAMDDVYGGTNRYLNQCACHLGLDISMVDCTVVQKVADNIKDNTKLIWLETPTNPTLKIVDITAVCQVVRAKTAKRPEGDRPIVVVDNTFQSAYFQRPLSLGADMVMHSVTKYMNGHSDVVMGALVCNDSAWNEKLRFYQKSLGAIPSPFDCYLANRGLKTLHVRMREHQRNGLAVAKFLQAHPAVEKAVHPGLPSHPQHELAKRQMIGYSGMCVFYIKGGLKEAKTFFENLKVFTLAESLGGYESLCELPCLQTHASVPEAQRKELGITDNFIRLSVGLEDVDDLIQDLDTALRAAVKC